LEQLLNKRSNPKEKLVLMMSQTDDSA